jgi:hypothetical protein
MEQADSADVVDELVTEEVADEPQTEEAQSAPEAEATEEAVSDELIITIGEEPPPPVDDFDGKPAPAWVKELRRENKEKSRRLRELEQQLQQQTRPETAPVLPQKPTLESCDYDADKFEAELEGWHDKKRAADELKRKAEAEQEAAKREWQGKLEAYATAKASLKVADFDEAEEVVKSTLSELQQSVILSGAKNPALLVAAIGKHPSKAKELAAIKDPVKFAFAVAQLEMQVKSTSRTSQSAPPPERVVRGNVAGAAAADNVLEKLREEAARTGDFSKIVQYKAQLRKK